jgi:hypothetical protein
MIPTILFLLLRKYKRTNPEAAARLAITLKKASRTIFIFVMLVTLTQLVQAQDKKLDYIIKRKNSEVGQLSFSQQSKGNNMILKLHSEVKTRILFLFTAKTQEEAVFENGVLVSSSLYRKMNGREKANKRTRLAGNSYIITKDNQTETMSAYPIRFSMLNLYCTEPVSLTKVYSDNFQQFLDIQLLAPHHYKIKFPDGNSNEYFYQNGICARIRINHSMYSATIELKS